MKNLIANSKLKTAVYIIAWLSIPLAFIGTGLMYLAWAICASYLILQDIACCIKE